MRMLKLFTLLLTFLVSALPVAEASPVTARIPSGSGILLINKLPAGINFPIIIYKEPSLGRLAELEPGRLPSLSQSISSPDLSVPVIVTLKKSGWYKIIYGDGEREGWIENQPSYKFIKWAELLRGRSVSLIGGLRKEFYTLRRKATVSSEQIETVEKGKPFTPLHIDGDWMLVTSNSRAQGWLRWKDDNSRLVISFKL